MHKITIVIPVYNREDIVLSTLQSVHAQTYRPLRVVLVDNNSSDGTMQVLQKWKRDCEGPDFTVDVVSEATRGAAAARNAGLDAVRTEWCMFFDSDDTMLPNHVELAMNYIAKNPDMDIVGWPSQIGARQYDFDTDNPHYANVFNSMMKTPSYCARTSLFRAAGAWTSDMPMAEDVELGTRLLRLAKRIGRRPGPVTYVINTSRQSVTATYGQSLDSYEKALESVRRNLPPQMRHWVDLRYIILGTNEASKHPQSNQKIKRILAATPMPRRLLWHLFHMYSRMGGRGVSRIYKMLK